MLKKLYPYEYVRSVFTIDYEKLYKMGYRGLIFDIDNTLVLHGTDSTPEIDNLFKDIQAIGFKTLLLSNNEEKRINRFMKNIRSYYIHDAEKPKVWGYKKALEVMELDASQVLVVGDQAFTDILGANRAGLASILVQFLRWPGETSLGKRRRAEQVVLKTYHLRKKYCNRLGDVEKKTLSKKKQRRNFCDIHPAFYWLSTKKETFKRYAKDFQMRDSFARERTQTILPSLVSSHQSKVIKVGPGIDPVLQENKAVNIQLACDQISGIIIHSGQVFSFWQLVGKASAKKGYKDGRVIEKNHIIPGLGGGLCNLANTINLLALHSPMTVTEFHKHSDALACDIGHRVPLSAGTSIYYNYVDYRFKNETKQDMQLLVWVANGQLYGELRSVAPFPYDYELNEEEHRFVKVDGKVFRKSKIYKDTIDKTTKERINRELIWDNHSEVMFPIDMIPPEMIVSE